jgi:PhnB protein
MNDKVKAIPEGMHTVTPYMAFKDTMKAIEFYQKAFDAKDVTVLKMPDGKVMHAEITIGDSRIMMGDECPERGHSSPETVGVVTTSLMIYCENVDTAFEKAVNAGCTVQMPLMNMFWGDRYGQLHDPFGHKWSLAQHIEDVSLAEMEKRGPEAMKQMAAAAK